MGQSQVPLMLASPHMEAKCANFWARFLETFKVWFLSIRFGYWLCYANKLTRLVLKVKSSLLLDPTLNISPKPHLQNVLLCKHSCQTRNLGLGIPREVASPNFHALSGSDCADGRTLSDLGVRTWDPCASALSTPYVPNHNHSASIGHNIN